MTDLPFPEEIRRLRIFAGPNGSGKSTLIKSVIEHLGVHLIGVYVNADNIDREIRATKRLSLSPYGIVLTTQSIHEFFQSPGIARRHDAVALSKYTVENDCILLNATVVDPYAASTLAELLRQKLLEQGVSFSFETVFSHPSKIEFMRKAKAAGYRVYLYFVSTADPVINVARVQERVRTGGHDVPKEKITERYWRSLDFLHEASLQTYRTYFFDNSGKSTVLVAQRQPTGTMNYAKALDDSTFANWFHRAYELVPYYRTLDLDRLIGVGFLQPVTGMQFQTVWSVFVERLDPLSDTEKERVAERVRQNIYGRPTINQRRNLIHVLILIADRYGSQAWVRHGPILDSIKDCLNGFAKYPLWKALRVLEENLHRVIYKLTFLPRDKHSQRIAEANAEFLLPAILRVRTDNARNRVISTQIAVEDAFFALRRNDVDQLESLSRVLAELESSIEGDFKEEFEKIQKAREGDLSFYYAYGKPFDFLNAGLFSVLTQEFQKISPYVDDEIIDLTKAILARRSSSYQINYADNFLLKWIFFSGRIVFASDDLSQRSREMSYFSSVLSHGHIDAPRNGSREHVVWGQIAAGEPDFLHVYGILDAEDRTFTVARFEIRR